MWNVATGVCTHTLLGHTDSVNCVAYDGNTIVSGCRDASIRVWHTPFTEHECARVLRAHARFVHRVWLCAAPDEHILVSVDNDVVHVHDIRTGERVCEPIDCSCKSATMMYLYIQYACS